MKQYCKHLASFLETIFLQAYRMISVICRVNQICLSHSRKLHYKKEKTKKMQYLYIETYSLIRNTMLFFYLKLHNKGNIWCSCSSLNLDLLLSSDQNYPRACLPVTFVFVKLKFFVESLSVRFALKMVTSSNPIIFCQRNCIFVLRDCLGVRQCLSPL